MSLLAQTSGVSAQNFNGTSVTYTANGSNGCTQTFVVKATNQVVTAGKSALAKNAVGVRDTLDLIDFLEITRVDAIGIPKTTSSIELKPFGSFNDSLQVLVGVKYPSDSMNFTLGEDQTILPSVSAGKISYAYIASGKLP